MSDAGGERMPGQILFTGDYGSWPEARAASTGYDAPAILERVVAATRKVVRGEAAYERDGVTFDEIEDSPPLLACLLYAASRLGNSLDLLDYGGSLGTSYRQNRRFLRHLQEFHWSIVEQPAFVAAGRAEFEDEALRFYDSIEACFAESHPRTALLSSLLPYVEKPHELLAEVLERSLDLVVIDRTPFFVGPLSDRLTVEHVPPEIYEASYPAWFFGWARFSEVVEQNGYRILARFDSWERWRVDGAEAQSLCVLLGRHEGGWG